MLTELETRAIERGVSLSDLYTALEKVHRDKRVSRTVRRGEVVYLVARKKSPLSYLTWKNENYPEMDETNNADHPAFADLDYSYLFLTPEELERYKAELKGRAFIPKKRYQHGKQGKQGTERSVELSPTQRSLLLAQQQHGTV